MTMRMLGAMALVAMVGMMIVGCKKADDPSADGRRTIVIGMVAKSQSNDVFQAAYSGAKDAARELGEKMGVNVTIDWRTPVSEDATKQAEAIEALTRARVAGIIVSCTDGNVLRSSIDAAADAGIWVMTFDSDSPQSKRFAYYGSDNRRVGEVIMAELAAAMNGQGTVAILGGNQNATNLQDRVNGARSELAKHPGMKLTAGGGGVFYHEETPEKAAEAVAVATNANSDIQGWAFIGGWPLFTTDALRWEPGRIRVVSCDALPAQLGYLKSGHVDVLMAQDCYGWGYKSVEVLLNKIVNNTDPESPILIDPLTKVTRDNADEYGKQWEKWLGR